MSADPALRAAWRRALWIVPGCAVVSVAAAAVMTARQTPTYLARATLAVAPKSYSEQPGSSRILDGIESLERRTVVATFAAIPSTFETLDEAARLKGIPQAEAERYRIEAFVRPNTNVISIEVSGPDPRHAADLANAAAKVTAHRADELYRIYDLPVLAAARPPSRPLHPDPARNLLVAGVLGLFAGILVSLALGQLGRLRRADRSP